MPDPKPKNVDPDAVIGAAKRARRALGRKPLEAPSRKHVPNEREFRMEQQAEAGAENKPPPLVTSPQPGDHLVRKYDASHFDPAPDTSGAVPRPGDVYDQRTKKWRPNDVPVRRYDPNEDKKNEPKHQWRRRPPEVFRDPREHWFDKPKPPVTRI